MARHKPHTEFITGLDIGSSMIRIAVGQLTVADNNEPMLQIIGAVESPSEGIQKGTITSIEDTVSSIADALEKAEQLTGLAIEHVWVGVSAPHIISQESRGVIAVSRTNGEISGEDVDRAVEAAKMVASPLNYEVLHVLPRGFAVDGQTGIKDPVGMTGIRLEVDTKLIYGPTSHIKNLTKAVYRVGLDIDDFVLSILAAADAVATNRQRELGAVVVDIGGPITSIAVYEEGDLVHTAVLPIGSSHVTNDLALGLKTSIDIAERVKKEFGDCVSKGINKKEMVDLLEAGAAESELVSRQYIAQIMEARVVEILEKIDAELERIERSGLLPAGAIFIGGGAKMQNLTECARAHLQLPATLGRASGIGGIADNADDLGFIPVVGLVKWGSQVYQNTGKKGFSFNGMRVRDTFQKLFKSFVP